MSLPHLTSASLGLGGPDGPITLGFRAEDASLGSDGGAGQLKAAVYSLELLGDSTMVTVKIEGALVSIKADKTFRAEIGDEIVGGISAGICHLFDATSGERL